MKGKVYLNILQKYMNFYLYSHRLFKSHKKPEFIEILLTWDIYPLHGEKVMKGRTTCPKCNHEFVLDTPEGIEEYKAICPNCGCKFTIRKTSDGLKAEEECTWEEHGEPRKTILSSIKPRTDKPMMAAVILVCVFVLGASSAAFSETFIEAPLGVLSGAGMTGTVEFMITDQSNNSLENVSITINNVSGKTNVNGKCSVKNVSLGIKKAEIFISENKTLTREILVKPFINSYEEIIVKDDSEEFIPYDTVGCSIILLIFSVIALLGVVASLKRQHFDVAVAGSALGIFSFGFFMIGSILSIIALIIILRSKEEFEDGKKGKNF